MNKLTLFYPALTVLLLLQACKSNNADENSSMVDSVTVVKKVNPKQNIIIEKGDVDFITTAAAGNLAEIQLGRLARQKGANKRIKTFGMVIITDHSKINNKINSLASAKNIPLSGKLNAGKQDTITMLSKKVGSDFDRAYINSVIIGYKKQIESFETASKNSADPDIKSFATKTLPLLRAHLDAINAINDSMQ